MARTERPPALRPGRRRTTRFTLLRATRLLEPAPLTLAAPTVTVMILDLIYAVFKGITLQVQLQAAYYIPTVVVPALFVTHAMIFGMLLRRRA